MVRFITRKGGGMPDRTFDSIVDAAYWVIGERLSKGLPRTVANVLKTQGRHYGFDWTTRERRVTRRGGGLPDRTFDTVMDAARWCRDTGLSRTKNDVGAYSTILSVCFKKCPRFCGFEWELERPEDVGQESGKGGRRKASESGTPGDGRREQGRGLPELVRSLAANGLDDRAIAEALEMPLPVVADARKRPVVHVRDRIKAQFREDRKRIGLSRNMLADMLGANPATVRNWETPGKASVPGYARDLLSGLLDEYRRAVEQVVSGARGRSVTLGCYLSQGQYRGSGHARGHYAIANAVNREAAAILENRGTVVEFAYPDDAAAARNHVPEPEIALPTPAGGAQGDTADAAAPTAPAAEAAAEKGAGESHKARRRKKGQDFADLMPSERREAIRAIMGIWGTPGVSVECEIDGVWRPAMDPDDLCRDPRIGRCQRYVFRARNGEVLGSFDGGDMRAFREAHPETVERRPWTYRGGE